MCSSGPFQALKLPQLFLGFHLRCASDIFPSFIFMVLHISTYSMWSVGVLFCIISLRFFIRVLVGDIFGFFYFLICFFMLIARCSIISVMFLFRLSMSSCSSSAVNLFFYFELKRVLSVILWSLPMLTRFMTVTSGSLAQAEASCRPFWCICLSSNFRIKVPHHNCVMR